MPGSFRPDVTLPALWTDRPDWLTHLRALSATGYIDQAEADQLAHFAEHGWLVMPRAIEPELVDAFVTWNSSCWNARTLAWKTRLRSRVIRGCMQTRRDVCRLTYRS